MQFDPGNAAGVLIFRSKQGRSTVKLVLGPPLTSFSRATKSCSQWKDRKDNGRPEALSTSLVVFRLLSLPFILSSICWIDYSHVLIHCQCGSSNTPPDGKDQMRTLPHCCSELGHLHAGSKLEWLVSSLSDSACF